MKVMVEGVEEIVVDPKRQAEVLNEFYASAFTRSVGTSPVKERGPQVVEIREICIGEERVNDRANDRATKRAVCAGSRWDS